MNPPSAQMLSSTMSWGRPFEQGSIRAATLTGLDLGLDHLGDQFHLGLGELDVGRGVFLLAQQLAKQAHGGNGMPQGIFTEIHVDDGDTKFRQLLVIGGILGGLLGLA
ncbi:hypothetical protein [Billgrantia antri]|uniref:hypothetical protein n=1 Tax=Billgrantia antri TaxID=2846777 RepID=UPI003B20BEE7